MTTGSEGGSSSAGFESFLASLCAQFGERTASSPPLFETTAEGLFDTFLGGLAPEHRQHYTCETCRSFFRLYGGLVTIDDAGKTTPLFWSLDDVPERFAGAVKAVAAVVSKATVKGVFYSALPTWGRPSNTSKRTGIVWHHIAVVPDPKLVFRVTPLRTVNGAMGEAREEYAMLERGLAEFPRDVVQQAHRLLSTGALYRSEKCIGVAEWLQGVHEARAKVHGPARDNVTWRAVATAQTGFCHVRSSMIGTLLEDIVARLPFEEIKGRFDAKMDPTKYQRPVALPSDGNIAQAEAVVKALDAAGALDRRFARIEDLETLWRPAPAKTPEASDGVFGHLKGAAKQAKAASVEVPTLTMTWEKFARTVLPTAETIEYQVPAMASAYAALVTAVNPEAPPILQWDHEGKRNPVSWYFYTGGSMPARWGLTPGEWRTVTAVALQPTMWGGETRFAHQGEKAFFLLEGATDREYVKSSGYFPEFLKSEFHPVRRTMEAHAQRSVVAGAAEATACGLGVQKGGSGWQSVFRVTSRGATQTYKLDRWD